MVACTAHNVGGGESGFGGPSNILGATLSLGAFAVDALRTDLLGGLPRELLLL